MARRRQRALTDRDAREALLRSLMANVPGAIYRSAWHADYTLELISDEIERISGYPASDFLGADARRTIMSIICAEDRAAVLERAQNAVDDGQPFDLEYRIERPDGELRWVLDRGHRVRGPRGEEWMDGAIFDITERRANEEALRRHAVERARMQELRASQARIIEAADAARRRIERDLHDGAQQHLVALALEVRLARSRAARDPRRPSRFLEHVGEALAAASAELRELAHGIHPAVLTERGLAAAVQALAGRSTVPVEVLETPADRLAAADRGRRLLRRRRGADQRRQVRAGVGRHGQGDGRQWRARGRGERRRRRRRRARRGLGAARAVGPRRAPSTGR